MLRRLTFTRTLHTLLMAAALVVSLNSLPAQSNANAAKVLVETGTVSIIKDSSGYTFALMDNTLVNPGYTVKTGSDGYAKLQVPDGSIIEVFPDSEVVYRRTNSIGDLLNVWLGKVKIVIQHLPGVPNPNQVTTPTALISVRGTVFDVDVEDPDGTTFVSLDEGVVDVQHRLKASDKVTLMPGQAIRVYPNQRLVPLNPAKADFARRALDFAKNAVYDYIYSRPGGVGAPGGGPTTSGGAQGDKDKNSGKTGTGTPPVGTGAPPTPPPPPPGGGGGDL